MAAYSTESSFFYIKLLIRNMEASKPMLVSRITTWVALPSVVLNLVMATVALRLHREISDLEVGRIESNLFTLTQLRIQRYPELVASREELLESQIARLDSELKTHPGKDYFLWKAKMYYETNNIHPPATISRIIARAPIMQPTGRLYHHQTPDMSSGFDWFGITW